MTSTAPRLIAPALTGDQIRQKFLEFYAAKGHRILPSASLIPEDPTVLLTIAGMLPFKPIFLGQQAPTVPRATTSQKCIRTNDIENVGRTARHHTFFEMLGNFSFGDYFKTEAISWAWELLTEVYQLPPDRLVVSVFESDDQAWGIWHEKIGITPEKICRMGEESNFWTAGPTGPCGPCSEIYYDFHPERGTKDIDLDDDSRFIELYNLVFMELNQDSNKQRTPLQAKNIDTGMGLERMAQVLQGVPNNYETDLIFPIIQATANLANLNYADSPETTKTSLKVIGDHIRAVVHLISDGVTASNVGRGYVLRRLIRRVVRHGRLVGINKPFTTEVAEVALQMSEAVYPQVRQRQAVILAELEREEENFLKTLDRGEKLLAEIIAKAQAKTSGKKAKPGLISGLNAFTLYDTYGFPLELTQEIAAEHGLTVDEEGFKAEMEAQRQRSQAAHETIDLTVQGSLDQLAEHIHSTKFMGYDQFALTTEIAALLVEGEIVKTAGPGTLVQVILTETPFYAESGGQIGDRGYLAGSDVLVQIEDVQKENGIFVHYGRVERGNLQSGDPVTAQIDLTSRRRVQAHHTATHLLQAALKKLIDDSISQAGSLVAFDRLRFDFNCPRALTPAEVQQVEDQVNTWITESHTTQTEILPIAAAQAKGAIAMFGEKYGAEVRVMDVPGVSMELCGGTHVSNTAEIGLFKIIAETGVASGIRRIEAIAGPAVRDYLNQRDQVVRELMERFKVKPEEIMERITGLQTELKTTQKERETLKAELALLKAKDLLTQAQVVNELNILVAELPEMDANGLKTTAEWFLQKLSPGAVVLGSGNDGKVSLVAALSPEAIQQGYHAGNLIKELAQLCGGGGGGRPNFAQAGGKQPDKLGEALNIARTHFGL